MNSGLSRISHISHAGKSFGTFACIKSMQYLATQKHDMKPSFNLSQPYRTYISFNEKNLRPYAPHPLLVEEGVDKYANIPGLKERFTHGLYDFFKYSQPGKNFNAALALNSLRRSINALSIAIVLASPFKNSSQNQKKHKEQEKQEDHNDETNKKKEPIKPGDSNFPDSYRKYIPLLFGLLLGFLLFSAFEPKRQQMIATTTDFIDFVIPVQHFLYRNSVLLATSNNVDSVEYTLVFPSGEICREYSAILAPLSTPFASPAEYAAAREEAKARLAIFAKKYAYVAPTLPDHLEIPSKFPTRLPGTNSISSDQILTGGFQVKHKVFMNELNQHYDASHTLTDSRIAFRHETTTSNTALFFNILFLCLIAYMLTYRPDGASRGMGMNPFNMKTTQFKIDPSNNKIRFKDVAGLGEAKVEVMELVSFLKDFEQYRRLGARIPKGALLVGPPGTGKTLLAKAIAGESNVAFFSLAGSDFLEMFVGVGASRVRDLFRQARQAAPSIIFIDEIDAIGRERSKKGSMGGNDERENTLNQILVEMDGFTSNENIIVLASTNRVDILDKALLRPGRFDRQILVDRPDLHGRRDILKVHLGPIKLSQDIDEVATKVAALTPGMVGADLSNVCNEAAILAGRQNKDAVDLIDFERAVDRVLAGFEKKSKVITEYEKRTVAYHEAGHAVIGWFLEHADPLLKVTIVPRSGGALGFAQYLPNETGLIPAQALLDRICMALGGRASEEINFGKVTTGASDDIMRTTSIARAMVQTYGMSSKLFNYSTQGLNDGSSFDRGYSEKTAELIDEEAFKIVEEEYARAKSIINEKKDLVTALAEELLAKETLNHDDIVAVLGPRPYITDSYVKYVEQFKAMKEAEAEQLAKEALKKSEEEKSSSEEKDKVDESEEKHKVNESEEKHEVDESEKKDKVDESEKNEENVTETENSKHEKQEVQQQTSKNDEEQLTTKNNKVQPIDEEQSTQKQQKKD